MPLTSPEYFVFLVVVYFAYWLTPRPRLAGLPVILAANAYFYAKWSPVYLALIPAAAGADFLLARAMEGAAAGAARRTWVSLSVAINVGLIASAKYVPLLAGGGWAAWTLPLGLSFYGFQAMTYTIDVYRRDAKAASSYGAYLRSVSFFPTTLAGPITRVAALMPQWDKTGRTVTAEEGGRALFWIGLGLMKKFLIADYLGEHLVNRVFDLPKLYSGFEALMGVYGYAFQLYYDFSGYTDIALGSALLLGVKLPPNFNRPYTAEDIADFWRRWHISLSNWLRDYLFFSLPGKRSRLMPYVNLIVTFAIGGIWHGARWTFGLWGLMHGAGLALTRGWQAWRGKRKQPASAALRVVRILATFHFVAFTWIFFRAGSVETARDIVAQIFSGTWGAVNISGGFRLVFAIAVVAHYWPKGWYRGALSAYCRAPFYAQAAALALLALAIRYLAATGAAPFVYQRF